MRIVALDALAGPWPLAASVADAQRAIEETKPEILVVAANGWGVAFAQSLPEETRPAVLVVGDFDEGFVGDEWVRSVEGTDLDARLGVAFARARRRRRTARRALIDPLTRLPNRRAAIRGLVAGAARAKRGDRSLSIVLLDLDHFKAINDELGHDEGDRVLRRVGTVLAGIVRREEIAARIGGDEFAVVASCSLRDARAIARRIRAGLGQEGIRASAAVGELRAGERLRDLYRRTDAMLRAKKGHGAGYHAAA